MERVQLLRYGLQKPRGIPRKEVSEPAAVIDMRTFKHPLGAGDTNIQEPAFLLHLRGIVDILA